MDAVVTLCFAAEINARNQYSFLGMLLIVSLDSWLNLWIDVWAILFNLLCFQLLMASSCVMLPQWHAMLFLYKIRAFLHAWQKTMMFNHSIIYPRSDACLCFAPPSNSTTYYWQEMYFFFSVSLEVGAIVLLSFVSFHCCISFVYILMFLLMPILLWRHMMLQPPILLCMEN